VSRRRREGAEGKGENWKQAPCPAQGLTWGSVSQP